MTFDELQNEFLKLKGRLDAFERGDRFVISKLIQIGDGHDIQLGRSTGTMIGTATDQKLGFFGHTPVVKQGAISAPSGGSVIDIEGRNAITSIINKDAAYGL